MSSLRSLTLFALSALVLAPVAASAQQRDSGAVKAVTPQLDFSGLILGNYQYKTDSASKAGLGGNSPNKFEIERVYLTFRMPVGERMSIRATTDIFQQTNTANNGFYAGWVVRLKYGYLQYNFANDIGDVKGFNALARIGMLHNVVIDHEELFWPRYLSQAAVERNGFFSSADLGLASLVTLPNKWGEVYATITNGPGYTNQETDRFKDFALRLTLTPLSTAEAMGGYFKTFAITPWYYKGFTGSKYQASTFNTVTCVNCPINDGLQRDRFGIFTGIRDRRLTLGAEYAQRMEDLEGGANTVTSPRTVTQQKGQLISAFAIARPLEWMDAKEKSNFGLVGRIDQFTPNTNSTSTTTNTLSSYDRLLIAGVFWEPTPRTALTLDYQGRSPQSGSLNVEQTTWFLHWKAEF
ncbi:MAG: hypothetical protein M3081_00710 [Gemmatimonadota bacterium]|nr:hypothetical protein [Gemmatimonadota bacterium]